MKTKYTYDTALTKLQEIVADIEQNKVGIDVLSKKVAEATELITFCQNHLTKTEKDVAQVLRNLNQPNN